MNIEIQNLVDPSAGQLIDEYLFKYFVCIENWNVFFI